MRITCPACHAETSLEVVMARDTDARAVAAFLAQHLQLGDVLVQYVALFRPAKRRLGLARMVALLEELIHDIERGAIARKGRDWPAPAQAWRIAIGQMLLSRDKGTLTLPLTGHGYLYEVLQGLGDKAESLAEREGEAARRKRGPSAGTPNAQPVAAVSALAVYHNPPTVPPIYADGPSPAARRIKAQMLAAAALRTPSTDAGEPT